jgi:hypothetical protein
LPFLLLILDAVFSFPLSVKRIKIIYKLHGRFGSFEHKNGIDLFSRPIGVGKILAAYHFRYKGTNYLIIMLILHIFLPKTENWKPKTIIKKLIAEKRPGFHPLRSGNPG